MSFIYPELNDFKAIFKIDDPIYFHFSEHHEPAEKDDVSFKKDKSYSKNSSNKDDKKQTQKSRLRKEWVELRGQKRQ